MADKYKEIREALEKSIRGICEDTCGAHLENETIEHEMDEHMKAITPHLEALEGQAVLNLKDK